MRVLHVGPDMSSKGGIASVLSGYAASEALFISLGYAPSFQASCGHGGTSRLFQFALAWWRIVSDAVTGKVDIVHIHTSIRGSLLRKSLLAATCIALRQRYIVHLHSGAIVQYVEELPALGRRFVRFVWKHSAQLICLSREMQEWLSHRCKLDASKCQLVYNGIADPSRRDYTRASPRKTVSILFLGKLMEMKGTTVLLDAAEKLAQRGHSYKLLVGGTGDVNAFVADIERRGLSDRVTYLGWVAGEKKTHFLAQADVFVLPSRSEGFPVSIVEAMAFGAAIVSTNIPGVVDAITHEREGLLVPPDDANALADALSVLIEAPALRGQLAAAARERFLRHFTIQHTVAGLVQVYNKVM